MKKRNVLSLVLRLIFPLIFNAIFFVTGGVEHNTSVWISYGFVHWAYAMLLLSPSLVREGKSAAVFGFALYSITYFYFFAELIVGVLFMLIAPDGFKTAFWIQLLMAGAHGVMLVTHMIANEKTADAEQTRQPQIDYIKKASAQLKLILNQIQDRDAQRKVERAYDALYSSPVKSHPEFERMEKGILSTIDSMSHALASGNKNTVMSLADSLLRAIDERNLRLRQHHR